MEVQNKIKKSVRIREKKEALKKWKEENKGHLGATKASLKKSTTAPRKMRLVADMIKGLDVNVALNALKFEPKHASFELEKLLLTAIADWQLKNPDEKIESAGVYVKNIFVDSAKMLKRLNPASKGRAYRIRKRSNHVTLILDKRPQEIETKPQEEKITKDK